MNPFAAVYKLFRNPKYKKAGTFVTLSDFLSLTKDQTSLSGILIIVEVRPSMLIIRVLDPFFQMLFIHTISIRFIANLYETGLVPIIP
jgi:hypothetical protein